MPRPPAGRGKGFLLALIAHAGLVVALAFSVRWRASEPEAVTAELWAAVPQAAAPRAVEPEVVARPVPKPVPVPVPKVAAPPPAPDAQIAIEKAQREAEQRKAQTERELQAQRKKQQAEEDARQAARIEAQREATLKRLLGQAGATGAPDTSGAATQSAGPSASYAGRIKGRIKPNIVYTESVAGNPVAEVEVRAAPDGTIVGRKLIKSSGIPDWDDAVLRAIDKTEILPRDVDGRVPSSLVIAFRPRD